MNDVMWISILNGITPIVFGVILFFMPESPLYFIMKGKDEMAIKAMENFRGANFDVGPEISEFKVSQSNFFLLLFYFSHFQTSFCIS